MKGLRSPILIGALVALALGFILILQGPVSSAGGPPLQWGPGMMGRGMGPGMMWRGGPGAIGPQQAPSSGTPTPSGGTDLSVPAGADLSVPAIILLFAGGGGLLGWWWAGRPARSTGPARETPMEIARRRYVDGEITLLEFDEIVQGLLSSEARELEPARRRKG